MKMSLMKEPAVPGFLSREDTLTLCTKAQEKDITENQPLAAGLQANLFCSDSKSNLYRRISLRNNH